MIKVVLDFLTTCKDVLLSPRVFFRKMPITEGIRKAIFFALFVYYVRSVVFFIVSYYKGYFFNPIIRVSGTFTAYSAIFLALTPFLLLLIIYTQSIFINRIGNFFGGVGNFEGGFKIMAYVLFMSLFLLIPVVNIAARIYSTALLIIGVREVYSVDYISSTLTMFFSYVFTAFLYVVLFVLPILIFKMAFIRF